MTKVVQLSDPAYERLRAQKRPGESFSDVVLRAIGRPSLLGLLTRAPRRSPEEIEAHLRLLREINGLDARRDAFLDSLRKPPVARPPRVARKAALDKPTKRPTKTRTRARGKAGSPKSRGVDSP